MPDPADPRASGETRPGRKPVLGLQPARQTLQQITAISLVGTGIGLTAAFATMGFIGLIDWLNDLLFVSSASRATLSPGQLAVATVVVLSSGGLLLGLLLYYGVQQRSALGPADTLFAVQLHERLPSPLSGLASTLAAALSLGCGASVGQYGPLVYLGTTIGQISNYLPLGLPHLRTMTIACGVAAAIATAFNAPLAALIFTHEVILRHYSLRLFTAVTIASASGYFVANVVFERTPLFLVAIDGSFRAIEFLLFAGEGVACGILAVLLMKALRFGIGMAQNLRIYPPLKPMIAGFATSLVALQVPEVLGAGQEVFREAILGNSYSADALLWILLAKLLVTVACVGFGFAGGVIFPSMLIGALFGAMFALLVPAVLLDSYSGISDYAICGMVALMSPVIGAPMTALLLVFEMTRNYEVTIAAMVAVVFANLVASIWFGRSLYDQQLAQRGIDLSLGRERAYLMHHKVREHLTDCLPVVTVGSPVEEARALMASGQNSSAVVVDDRHSYLGMLQQAQLADPENTRELVSHELTSAPCFDEKTSLWEAMQVMRSFLGEAIAVVDSTTGRYLGAIPESAVINAYLDATEALRREEHEI